MGFLARSELRVSSSMSRTTTSASASTTLFDGTIGSQHARTKANHATTQF
jgi:hypothetical protein